MHPPPMACSHCSRPAPRLIADRAYDTNAIRAFAADRGAWANIPPRSIRKDAFSFSGWVYRQRNLVERFFNRIKQQRAQSGLQQVGSLLRQELCLPGAGPGGYADAALRFAQSLPRTILKIVHALRAPVLGTNQHQTSSVAASMID
jgi:transposase